LDRDNETNLFIEQVNPKGVFKTFMYYVLSFLVSRTDSQALLGSSDMFVFSTEQLKKLGFNYIDGRILDIGAGSGSVTEKYKPLFREVITTEVSWGMANILREKGYICIETSDINNDHWLRNEKFEVISCLNVLDRCSEPLSLLIDIKKFLSDYGKLIISVVLPFKCYVENGRSYDKPEEKIDLGRHSTFEEYSNIFYNEVLSKCGYLIESYSKVPYLSEGDLDNDYYILPNAIFVLSMNLETISILE